MAMRAKGCVGCIVCNRAAPFSLLPSSGSHPCSDVRLPAVRRAVSPSHTLHGRHALLPRHRSTALGLALPRWPSPPPTAAVPRRRGPHRRVSPLLSLHLRTLTPSPFALASCLLLVHRSPPPLPPTIPHAPPADPAPHTGPLRPPSDLRSLWARAKYFFGYGPGVSRTRKAFVSLLLTLAYSLLQVRFPPFPVQALAVPDAPIPRSSPSSSFCPSLRWSRVPRTALCPRSELVSDRSWRGMRYGSFVLSWALRCRIGISGAYGRCTSLPSSLPLAHPLASDRISRDDTESGGRNTDSQDSRFPRIDANQRRAARTRETSPGPASNSNPQATEPTLPPSQLYSRYAVLVYMCVAALTLCDLSIGYHSFAPFSVWRGSSLPTFSSTPPSQHVVFPHHSSGGLRSPFFVPSISSFWKSSFLDFSSS